MLGTLARWLRFAGVDTFFEAGIDDDGLAAVARTEGRWLVTKDRRLAARAGPRSLLLCSGSLASQVAELCGRLDLEVAPACFFTRCSACNAALVDVERAAVVDRVPPFVAVTAGRFRECSGCGRVYWRGSHAPRIERRLQELFGPFTAA